MELLLLLAGGVLGIPASMVAAYLSGRISLMRNRRRLDIEGVWGEFIKDSEGHQYTLGQIYYDARRKLFAFDGTNYANDGEIFCHFETTTSSIDEEERTFLYTFRARVPNRFEVYYGFGAVNLALHNGVLTPADGHYVSASVDGRPMSHTMIRLPDMAYRRDATGEALVQRLSPAPRPPRLTDQRAARSPKETGPKPKARSKRTAAGGHRPTPRSPRKR